MTIVLIIGGYGAFIVLGWIFNSVAQLRENKAVALRAKDAELSRRATELHAEQTAWLDRRRNIEEALEAMRKEKSLGFPWLAKAYSDYFQLVELQTARDLETKKRPAKRSAEAIRAVSAEKAKLRQENRILRELHRYYEALFPWLIEFKGDELDDLIKQVYEPTLPSTEGEEVDPASEWLSQAEYNSETLSRSEKFQLALNRYWTRRKTPWQIGRDYERYVGYCHEREGFRVEYHGIAQGLEDLGRDLVCVGADEIRIVQCKCWRKEKVIHEKHICQLIGTSVVYAKTRQPELGSLAPTISAWLYTSCSLSETAKQFAEFLDVNIIENFALGRYPIIKCNVSKRDGTKIYHLPFDQQYDRTLIEYSDEHYVETVAEAEQLGFRRAFRWKGKQPQ